MTASDPTPPVAPVTMTSPRSGVILCRCRASTHCAAVKPAVDARPATPRYGRCEWCGTVTSVVPRYRDRGWEVRVDLGEGSDRVFVYSTDPGFSVGEMVRLENGRMQPFGDGPLITRRQEKPEVYARNGPAVLAVRTSTLLDGRLYGDDVRPLIMSAEASVDVDDAWDLEIAALALSRRTRQHP